ncbi:hypothetical protein C0J52_04883 [Blattella germanica]|nr:hypothetical protein C0J52_04883 [Blattella germanica]
MIYLLLPLLLSRTIFLFLLATLFSFLPSLPHFPLSFHHESSDQVSSFCRYIGDIEIRLTEIHHLINVFIPWLSEETMIIHEGVENIFPDEYTRMVTKENVYYLIPGFVHPIAVIRTYPIYNII